MSKEEDNLTLTVEQAEYIAYQEANSIMMDWIKRKLRLL